MSKMDLLSQYMLSIVWCTHRNILFRSVSRWPEDLFKSNVTDYVVITRKMINEIEALLVTYRISAQETATINSNTFA